MMPSVLTSLIRSGVDGLLQTISTPPISGSVPAAFISIWECLASVTRRHDPIFAHARAAVYRILDSFHIVTPEKEAMRAFTPTS